MSCTGLLLAAALSASPGTSGGTAPRVTASFPTAGITAVVLRASAVADATVAVEPKATTIKVSGIPSGGAKGYHPPDPKWKETSPTEWGLEFVAKRFGATLVISTRNEIQYIHHRYTLESLHVDVPPGIAVVREPRALGGDGAPDLKPPAKTPAPAARPTDPPSQN